MIFLEVMTKNVVRNHKKSLKIKKIVVNQNFVFNFYLFLLIISFLYDSTKNKISQTKNLLPSDGPEKT